MIQEHALDENVEYLIIRRTTVKQKGCTGAYKEEKSELYKG